MQPTDQSENEKFDSLDVSVCWTRKRLPDEAEKGGISMCVSFVRRMENMLRYLGPDIRVHNLKKIINYLLPVLLLNVPCLLAYSKFFQPTLEATASQRMAPPIPQGTRVSGVVASRKSVLV